MGGGGSRGEERECCPSGPINNVPPVLASEICPSLHRSLSLSPAAAGVIRFVGNEFVCTHSFVLVARMV